MFLIKRMYDDRIITVVGSLVRAETVAALLKSAGTLVYIESSQSVIY